MKIGILSLNPCFSGIGFGEVICLTYTHERLGVLILVLVELVSEAKVLGIENLDGTS